jgi:hypothetical protein
MAPVTDDVTRMLRWAISAIFGLFALCAVLVFGITEFYQRRERTVVFVLPDGFRGLIMIEEDPSGVDAARWKTKDGTYRIPVDATYRVSVRDADDLEDRGSAQAVYQNGSIVPVATDVLDPFESTPESTAVRKKVLFFSVYTSGHTRMFLVGTVDEFRCLPDPHLEPGPIAHGALDQCLRTSGVR